MHRIRSFFQYECRFAFSGSDMNDVSAFAPMTKPPSSSRMHSTREQSDWDKDTERRDKRENVRVNQLASVP